MRAVLAASAGSLLLHVAAAALALHLLAPEPVSQAEAAVAVVELSNRVLSPRPAPEAAPEAVAAERAATGGRAPGTGAIRAQRAEAVALPTVTGTILDPAASSADALAGLRTDKNAAVAARPDAVTIAAAPDDGTGAVEPRILALSAPAGRPEGRPAAAVAATVAALAATAPDPQGLALVSTTAAPAAEASAPAAGIAPLTSSPRRASVAEVVATAAASPSPTAPPQPPVVAPAAPLAAERAEGQSVPAAAAPSSAPLELPPPESAASVGEVAAPAAVTPSLSIPPQSPLAAPSATLTDGRPDRQTAAAVFTPSTPLPGRAPETAAAETARPDVRILDPDRLVAAAAVPAEADATAQQSRLAWTGHLAANLSAASVETIAALMGAARPEAEAALADGISAILEGLACSRLRTEFLPEEGVLALRGHVRSQDDIARAEMALRTQIEGALPVEAQLQLLPEPQCGVLVGLDRIGLPQSVDQLANPYMIGKDGFVSEFLFDIGDMLMFSFDAPNWPGHLYVDYFDMAGDVIHLVPNEAVPLPRVTPGYRVRLGTSSDDDLGRGRLRLQLREPFGREIVVALGTSRPLYEGLRPIREPATDYLAALADAVETAREADPGFRAEWAYLLISRR